MEKVKKGQRVIACNTIAWNKRSPHKLFAKEEFMEEGVVVRTYGKKLADVLFDDGNLMINGKISAFKPIDISC